MTNDDLSAAARALGRKGGSVRGPQKAAYMASLTPEQRTEQARRAALRRWHPEMRTREYRVDGWITVCMTEAQAARWNAGDMGAEECDRLTAWTTESTGPAGTIRDLLDRGEVTEEDLENPAEL